MGASKRSQLEHRLDVLIMHMLKFQMQPDHIKHGWISTIVEQRKRIHRLLKKMPSLRTTLDDAIVSAYHYAALKAVMETGLPRRLSSRHLLFHPVNTR